MPYFSEEESLKVTKHTDSASGMDFMYIQYLNNVPYEGWDRYYKWEIYEAYIQEHEGSSAWHWPDIPEGPMASWSIWSTGFQYVGLQGWKTHETSEEFIRTVAGCVYDGSSPSTYDTW